MKKFTIHNSHFIIYHLSFIFILLISGCDKIEGNKFETFEDVVVTDWNETYANTIYRKIYVEEFTGIKCPNCPAGARILQEIQNTMGDTLITAAIHATSLANPSASGSLSTNFKTPTGDILCNDFKVNAIPAALLCRIPNGNGIFAYENRNAWKTEIAKISRQPIAGIQLSCYVNATSKKIRATVAVTIIEPIPNEVQLCLVLLQDNIITGQIDGSTVVPEYVHNHAFRIDMNGTYGKRLTTDGMVQKQKTYTTGYSLSYASPFTIGKIPELVINNCSVVAYLINMQTKEVLQVEKVHLHE